jgi:hypothetical protein
MAAETHGVRIEFDFLPSWQGICDECGEAADTDAQTVVFLIGDNPPQHFHQVCAWKRATFIFGELF